MQDNTYILIVLPYIIMVNDIELTEGTNSEITADEVTAEQTTDSNQEKDFKKLYYKMANQYNTLKKQIEAPKDDLDLSDYEPEDVEKITKLAKKVAQQEIANTRQQELEQKELDAFLKANPEAYENVDELHRLRQQYPSASYNKLYKFLFDEEPRKITIASKNEVPQVTSWNDLSEANVNKAFQKMIGK